MKCSFAHALFILAFVAGCGDDDTLPIFDGGNHDAGATDASAPDAGSDAGNDAGTDAGPVVDVGMPDAGNDAGPPPLFDVSTPAFGELEPIPEAHWCRMNISPEMVWTPGPRGTLSYAVIMKDADAGSLIHWIIYDIPASMLGLPEGVEGVYEPTNAAPAKQAESLLAPGFFGYYGPCSNGAGNRYRWILHALPTETVEGVSQDMDPRDVALIIEDASIAAVSFRGVY